MQTEDKFIVTNIRRYLRACLKNAFCPIRFTLFKHALAAIIQNLKKEGLLSISPSFLVQRIQMWNIF